MHKEVFKQILTLSTAAFGLVAALAWNEAIQSLVNQYFTAGSGIWSKFIYAVIVTILAVLVTISLSRFNQEK